MMKTIPNWARWLLTLLPICLLLLFFQAYNRFSSPTSSTPLPLTNPEEKTVDRAAKKLRLDMPLDEVISLIGEPTAVERWPEESRINPVGYYFGQDELRVIFCKFPILVKIPTEQGSIEMPHIEWRVNGVGVIYSDGSTKEYFTRHSSPP